MSTLATVILAAGLGTRMKSERAKVLHRVAGRAMIEYPVALAQALHADRVVCVLGHQADQVLATVDGRFGAGAVEVALQHQQRGTGHALQQAAPLLAEHQGLLLILSGDVPLLTEATLRRLCDTASAGILAMLTFSPPSPRGYGRVVRDDGGKVVRIVEEKDCSETERRIGECNAGVYCGPGRFIMDALGSLLPNNAQGELYLTDIVARAAKELGVAALETPTEEVMGVNDRVDLARADAAMRRRLTEALMRSGVTVADPDRLHLEPEVVVGVDSTLGPGVQLHGHTIIGRGCRIDAGVVITDCTIGDGVHIKPYCVLTESSVGNHAHIGPFAHLRPGSVLDDDVHLGNFVETKKTRLGRGSKANHLSYLGDADIGARVNVGCGTITCNYDGYIKSKTVIEDDVFVGSDTQLVAPVTIHAGAVIAAGSTVVDDVPAGALVLTRVAQVHVDGWAARKRQKMAALKAGLPWPPARPKTTTKKVAKKDKAKAPPKAKSPSPRKPKAKRRS